MALHIWNHLTLEPSESGWLAVIMFGAALVALCIFNYYFHPASHVPGTFIAAIPPFWLMRAVYRRHLNLDIQKLHSQYGPYVRISPNEVSFATVEAQNTIHNPGPAMQGYFSKSGTMESMHGSVVWSGTDNVLTTTDKTAHKRLRNALLPAFTSEALFEHESIQQKHLHELIAKLRSIASEETVNLTEHLSKLIWDIVGDLSFGEPLVENQRERFDSLKIMFCQLSPLFEALQYLTRVPGIGGLVRFTVSLIPHVFRMPRGMLPTTALRKCMDWQDKRADFLTAIMNSKDNGVMLTDAEMKSNSSLLVMVGYDTTATTLSAIFYYLLRDPIRNVAKGIKDSFRTSGRHHRKSTSVPPFPKWMHSGKSPTPASCQREGNKSYITRYSD